MNKKNIIIGIVFIAIGLWLYFALSSFKAEENSSPKRIIIKEGIVKSEDEVARALAVEAGFDLNEAYKTGFTSRDIIDFLMKERHKLSFIFYNGRFYEDRITIPYVIPLSVCIIIIAVGAGVIVFPGIRKKS
jgi:flagellar basal body-associated protein FliL